MDTHTHTEEHAHGKHVTPKEYAAAFVALLLFMLLTIGAWKINLGYAANNIVAMVIAVTKATIVVLIFMQVKHNSKLAWLWTALGFIWLFFLFGIFMDYVSRDWLRTQGWN